jgi:hypothetical protein
MTGATRTLNQDLDAFLVVDGEVTLPVAARLTYEPTDPYAIRMMFRTGEGEVVWTFARDLLLDGMRRPAGEGDVLVQPDGEAITLVLSAPTGRAEFALDAFDIAVFLEGTTDAVPRGQEHRAVDLDDALRRLLEDAA